MAATTKHKVTIELITGATIWGYITIVGSQRVQDVLNDCRTFLPLYVLKESGSHRPNQSSEYKFYFLNKDQIFSITPS